MSSYLWNSSHRPLTPHEVLEAAQRTGATPREIALRAAALSIDCPGAEHFPDNRVPDPVDLALLPNRTGSPFEYPGHSFRASAGQVLHGYFELGLEIPEVRRRLARYGFDVGVVDRLPDPVKELDLSLVSWSSDGELGWLSAEFPVPVAHLVRTGRVLGIPVDLVRERIEQYGFVVEEGPLPQDDVDLLLLSRYQDGHPPWLDRDVPVPPGHVAAAAVELDMSPSAVVSRLVELGFDCRLPLVRRPTDEDKVLLSRDLSARAAWLEADQPVPPRHVGMFCRLHDASPEGAVRRLRAYGLDLAAGAGVTDVSREDLRLLSSDLDGVRPWLGQDDRLGLGHLVEAAAKFSMTVTEVADHLRRLGVDVPDPATMIRAAIPKIPLAR